MTHYIVSDCSYETNDVVPFTDHDEAADYAETCLLNGAVIDFYAVDADGSTFDISPW